MEIIAQLCLAAALRVCPEVVVVPPFPQGARYHPFIGQIYLSEGLARNKHELAFILGHELGHLHLRQYRHTEEEADDYSIRLIVPLGYDCRKGIDVLRRIAPDRWKKAKC